MNFRLVSKISNMTLLIIAAAMVPAFFTALYYHERDIAIGLAVSSAVTAAISGAFLMAIKPANTTLKPREGYLVVSLCWVLSSCFGALPFLIGGYTSSPIDAFFESCASITTTGATVSVLELMPRGLLMWKAMMHWLGGMGILVFAISILPAVGVSGNNLFNAESSNIQQTKLSGRMSDSARTLYTMYFGFTISEFLLLFFSKMTTFDAIITTLGSVSTSGLFAHSSGLMSYNSIYIELVTAFFTIAVSVKFSLYQYLLRREYGKFFDPEVKAFLKILFIAFAFVTLDLYLHGSYGSIFETMRYALFQVIAFGTTTGYGIANYTLWPAFSRFILFLLFFVGGCAASTSGSIKVVRVFIAFKLVVRNIYQRLHPNAVVAVKVGNKAIPAKTVSSVTSFIFMFFLVFFIGTLILSLQNLDLKTTVSSAISMLSGTGIAFGSIGATGNFSVFCGPLRLVLCALMLLGRLELFTIIMIFTPSFWNPTRSQNVA